jgi:hypothetical protein
MYAIHAQLFANFNDLIAAQVTLVTGRRPDANSFIRISYKRRIAVSLAVNSHGFYAHLAGAAHYTQSYLATVGYQYLFHGILILNFQKSHPFGIAKFCLKDS